MALTGAVTAEAGKAGKQRVKLEGNQTTVTLSAPVSKALTDNGVTVSLLGKATAGEGGAVVLPITGGRVNPQNLRGFVRHAGGVKLTKGDRSLSLAPLHDRFDEARRLPGRARKAREGEAPQARPEPAAVVSPAWRT